MSTALRGGVSSPITPSLESLSVMAAHVDTHVPALVPTFLLKLNHFVL